MGIRILSVCAAYLSLAANAGPFDAALLVGRTDKASTEYSAGEKMTFTLSLEKLDALPPGEWSVEWLCRGDDGKGCAFDPLQNADPEKAYFRGMARRIKCDVHVNRAGLGDYVSPPSGITVFYNNLVSAKSRKIDYVQGSRHGYIPPKK